MELDKRINDLVNALDSWLSSENEWLNDAANRTVEEGYFGEQDVRFALRTVRRTCNETALRDWADRAGLSENEKEGSPVLCLHAGNLPLVGFQDALAVLLHGSRYSGKISRKDPYLLPTFLNEVKKRDGWSDRDVQWTHRLDDFEGMRHDAVLFSGSEKSVPPVRRAVDRLKLADDSTRFLIRTAHFSMAYIDRRDKRTMEDLTEAILRYGGKGCRSVALVVSPFSLNEIKCELTDYIESFWLENPQFAQPEPALRYRWAYNKAVQRPQAWLDHFLLQEGGLELDQDFICYWIEGDPSDASELAERFGEKLQSIYIPHPELEIPGYGERTELLTDAQRPPIHWRPDGVDTLKWLAKGRR